MEKIHLIITIKKSDIQCFLTGMYMEDPVIISSGGVYEREAITRWFQTNKTDPITKAMLSNFSMASSKIHIELIKLFFAEHPELIEERYVCIN